MPIRLLVSGESTAIANKWTHFRFLKCLPYLCNLCKDIYTLEIIELVPNRAQLINSIEGKHNTIPRMFKSHESVTKSVTRLKADRCIVHSTSSVH